LGDLPNLEELRLYSRPSRPSPYPNGTSLAIGGQLVGEIPVELGNLVRLKTLYMNSLAISGNIPNIFSNMQNLSRLIISENKQITGPIPTEIGNLKRLTSLDLSRNSLTGDIPASFVQLESIEFM
jgi:hypothetical protein